MLYKVKEDMNRVDKIMTFISSLFKNHAAACPLRSLPLDVFNLRSHFLLPFGILPGTISFHQSEGTFAKHN